MIGPPAVTGPRDVVELRRYLLEQLPKIHQISSRMRDEAAAIHIDPRADLRNMKKAVLWWVSAPMAALISHAAQDLDEELVLEMNQPGAPGWLPDPAGFCVFEQPLVGCDANMPGGQVLVDAVLWGGILHPPTADSPAEPALGISSWRRFRAEEGFDRDTLKLVVETGTVAQAHRTDLPHEHGEPIKLELYGDVWCPLGRTDWRYGEPLNAPTFPGLDATAQRSMVEDRRWLATLALLSSQPRLADQVDYEPDRPTRRRAARAGLSSSVRLLRLRALHHPSAGLSSGGERAVEWQRRWIVSGHWRNQACGPGQSERRPTWIYPYEKGPEDKPLIIRDTVKVWDR